MSTAFNDSTWNQHQQIFIQPQQFGFSTSPNPDIIQRESEHASFTFNPQLFTLTNGTSSATSQPNLPVRQTQASQVGMNSVGLMQTSAYTPGAYRPHDQSSDYLSPAFNNSTADQAAWNTSTFSAFQKPVSNVPQFDGVSEQAYMTTPGSSSRSIIHDRFHQPPQAPYTLSIASDSRGKRPHDQVEDDTNDDEQDGEPYLDSKESAKGKM